MAVGDIYEVSFLGNLALTSNNYVTVLHVRILVDALTGTTESDIAASLMDEYRLNLLPSLNSDLRMDYVNCQRILPLPRTAGAQVGFPGGGAGGYAGDILPGQDCLLIKKRTAFAGRKYRGRIYQFGMSESDQNRGLWSSARVTAVRAFWQGILPNTYVCNNGTQFTFVVCSKNPATSADAYDITDTRYDDVVRSQRSRQFGKGK